MRSALSGTKRTAPLMLALIVAIIPQVRAQAVATTVAADTMLNLPDAPGAHGTLAGTSSAPDVTSGASSSSLTATDPADPQTPTTPTPKRAPHLQMTVAAGEIAGPMTVHDKVVGGLRDSVSLFAASGWFAAAGWEQLLNSSPNYGTDSGAFGQRLGAATLRGVSDGVLSESVFAPLFHEDPRYYVLGSGHSFIKRLFYAGTRAIVTRTDSGSTTPNYSLFAGTAVGSALTVTYYPKENTSFGQVAATFGGSIGGSALGFVVDEFIVDALVDLHLKKQQP